MYTDRILPQKIIGFAIDVHKTLGPGLFESVYKNCLAYELENAAIKYELEKGIAVNYKEMYIESGFRVDLLVENKIIVELKSVDKINPIHESQILTYLKLSGVKIGLLLNFNERLLHNGIKRYVM